jgi:hypothetical protein
MSNQKRYRLELTIDAPTTKELIYALTRINDRVVNNSGTGRFKVNDTTIEMDLSTYGEIDYRIDTINEKMCLIFKSKM